MEGINVLDVNLSCFIMDPEGGCFLRCGKHPLQNFTGICPSCLTEKLSSADPDKRKPPSYCGDGSFLDGISPRAKTSQTEVTEVEKVENCSCALPVTESQSSDVRVRQTLWSLFYLDSGGGHECHIARRTKEESLTGRKGGSLFEIGLHCESNVGCSKLSNGCERKQFKPGFTSVTKTKNFSNGDEDTKIFNDWGFNSEAGSSSVDNTSTDTQSCGSGNTREGVYFVTESRAPKSVANKYTQVESSVADEGNFPPSVHDRDGRFNDSMEEHSLKRSSSVRVGFGLVKRVFGWRMKSTKKRISKTDADLVGGVQNLPSEDVVDKGHPCRRESNDSIGRSSWDGLLIGKTLTRSLSVTEGRNGTSTKHVEVGEMLHPSCLENREGFSDSLPHIRRMTKKVGSVDFEWTTDTKDMNNIIPAVMNEDKSTSGVGFTGDSTRDRLCGSLLNEWSCSRKFHGCSKVWDRVIASPFWGFVQKSENVLDRSLSECWHESRKEKNREVVESYNKVGFHRNSSVSVRSLDKSQEQVDTLSSSLGTINANLHGFHSVWKRRKNYGMLAHSRSIQYSSPSNLDHGLLRFYLTPIRYNRRFASRNTRRIPHYFW